MKKLILLFIFILSLLAALNAMGDDTITQVTIVGTSNNEVPEKAKAESLRDALEKGSLQVIGTLIGASRLEKNSNTIHNKILSQASKFIQSYKASEPIVKAGETHTDVTMKISVTSVKEMLARLGLLFQNEGPPTVLPVIGIIEKRENGKQFSWWMNEADSTNSSLRDDAKFIIGQFDSVFRAKNFYVMDPLASHFVQWIPANYRVAHPEAEEISWLGSYLKAQIVIVGSAELEPTANGVKMNVVLTAYHSSNGRVVGEVTRTFEAEGRNWDLTSKQIIKKGFSEVVRDLATQVLDESTKGTLGATSVKVTFHGPFQYQDLEDIKKQITVKIGEVKTIRERLQEPGLMAFDMDFTGNVQALVKAFQSSSFEGFKLTLQSANAQDIDLLWAKVGSR